MSSSSSVLAKLKNESIKRKISNQQMIVLFLHEEFSRRLGISKNFSGKTLREAIYKTFKNRGHLDLIKNIHEIHRFKEVEKTKNMWNRFTEKGIKMIIEFDKVIDTILKFTLPICEAIENDEEFTKIWKFKEENYHTSQVLNLLPKYEIIPQI